jgi:hypothetical protein
MYLTKLYHTNERMIKDTEIQKIGKFAAYSKVLLRYYGGRPAEDQPLSQDNYFSAELLIRIVITDLTFSIHMTVTA